MKKIIILLFFNLISCRPERITPNPFTYYQKSKNYFEFVLNKKYTQIDQSNQNAITKLVNHQYPIEITLFSNNKFYYFLENLGEGEGSWKFKNGHIHLTAERKLFNMEMDIHAISEHEHRIAIDFIDRHGTQYLELEISE